jgi:hypothetical protein
MKCRVLAMLLLVTGCGGGGDDGGGGGGNRAIEHEFDYGAPAPASAAESTVLMTAIHTVQSVRSTPGAGAATALASFQSVTQQLLGAPGVASLRAGTPAGKPVPQTFEDCVVVTTTSITFDNCVTTSAGTTSVTDGTFTVLNGGADIAWELRIDVVSDSSGYHSEILLETAGNLSATATGFSGQFRSEIDVSLVGNGYSIAYGMSEAMIVDLSFASTTACVTSGTLEARRVWTQRPSGVPATSYPDRAVLIVWTGCNQATIARSR